MSSVRVKTLTGSSIDILVDPSTKVVDLKKSLRDSGNAILAKCKLFFSGAILRDDILLNSLDIPAGGFLVAIPMSFEGKQTRQVKALRQKESTVSKSSSIDLEGPSPTSPTGGQVCPGSRLLNSPIKDTRLDTLLPGYSIRPSPVKPGRGSSSSRPAALRENREDHEITVGLPDPNHCTKKPGLSFPDQAPTAADLLQPKLVVQDIVSEPGVVTPDDMSQEGQKGMCEILVLDQAGGDPFDAMLQKDGENRVTEIVDLSASPIKPGKLVRKRGSKAKTAAVVGDVQGGRVQNEEGMDRRRKRGNPRKVQEVPQDDSLEAGATSTKKVRKCKKKTSPVPLKPGMVETASAEDSMIQGHGNDLKTDTLVPISECYTGRPSPELQEDLNLVESLPLPPLLLRLRQALGALTEVHAFLIKRHVLPTWHALSSILRTPSQQHIEKECSISGSAIKDVVQSNGVEVLCCEAGLKLQDVLHLSALLPSVVVLRDRTRPHEDVVKPLLSLSDYPFLEAFDRKSALGSREDNSVEASTRQYIAPFSTELLHTNSTGAEVANVEGMKDAGTTVLAAAEQFQSHDTPVVPSRALEQPGGYNCPSSLVVDLIDPGKPVWERNQFETSLGATS
ncbi:hypothetical protein CEUSTIGMA_g9639.t1 [Chlamydomonas eustigma]|uniref:Ubiquitin-like domain-containing protein n=1 Tax=Chlamydomonas eustigma TaxID=1157962 RepID=A0A250XGK5_9CHLO|nr:hypothetical protein CEUSTIGMA_g9639.t1 [Chlamydomonas eustigma]|eukprot:GAX82211.1 hypothetical protein CEUSTIGMA_g9639.t1 [Chlamydomonas eustigma]